MVVKIFLTGATGYIGGDVLHQLHQKHAECQYALLIRSQNKVDKVLEAYPKARIVLGGLDDSETLEREASWADIVIHTADSSDHAGAAKAIAKGLAQGHAPSRPGFWLHTGGTGILTYFDSEVKKTFGEPDSKVFNDYDGVSELVNLPSEAFHRNVDEIVLEAGADNAESAIRTAIVCPPTIYGEGRGPVSRRGRQVYELTSFILKEKFSPRIGRGLARWNNVHVHDLSKVFELLIEAALDPARKDDAEIWGKHGYHLTENGEHVWGDLSSLVGKEAHRQGFLNDAPELRVLSYEEAVQSSAGFEAASWGLNSRGTAIRAKKILGWEPKEGSLEAEVPAIVRSEAARAGL